MDEGVKRGKGRGAGKRGKGKQGMGGGQVVLAKGVPLVQDEQEERGGGRGGAGAPRRFPLPPLHPSPLPLPPLPCCSPCTSASPSKNSHCLAHPSPLLLPLPHPLPCCSPCTSGGPSAAPLLGLSATTS